MWPASRPSRSDRECPLHTARDRCLWHVGGTASENEMAPTWRRRLQLGLGGGRLGRAPHHWQAANAARQRLLSCLVGTLVAFGPPSFRHQGRIGRGGKANMTSANLFSLCSCLRTAQGLPVGAQPRTSTSRQKTSTRAFHLGIARLGGSGGKACQHSGTSAARPATTRAGRITARCSNDGNGKRNNRAATGPSSCPSGPPSTRWWRARKATPSGSRSAPCVCFHPSWE